MLKYFLFDLIHQQSLQEMFLEEVQSSKIFFIDSKFSQICLQSSQFCFLGDTLQVTDYSGDFKDSRLNEAKEIFLIAAGTGLSMPPR